MMLWNADFIDLSNKMPQGSSSNNRNKFSSITVQHPVEMKESHKSMELLLSALNYLEHKLLICGDLKIGGLILGLQGCYTKYPYFLCLWNSHADDQHYARYEQPSRQGLKPGSHNALSILSSG